MSIHDHTEAPGSATLELDGGTLAPEGFAIPCPARNVAHLGFTEGVVVPCSGRQGHEGNHWYHIEWREGA